MQKEVRIKIRGVHGSGKDREVIENECFGIFSDVNGRHFLHYTEKDEETGAERTALIKLDNKTVTVKYNGHTETTMIFEVGKHTKSMYITPMGSMPIEIDTESMIIEHGGEELIISIDYLMSLGGGSPERKSINITVYF